MHKAGFDCTSACPVHSADTISVCFWALGLLPHGSFDDVEGTHPCVRKTSRTGDKESCFAGQWVDVDDDDETSGWSERERNHRCRR
jgi:hypothetical protein